MSSKNARMHRARLLSLEKAKRVQGVPPLSDEQRQALMREAFSPDQVRVLTMRHNEIMKENEGRTELNKLAKMIGGDDEAIPHVFVEVAVVPRPKP